MLYWEDVSGADVKQLREGAVLTKEWTTRDGHRLRSTLSWDERLGCPLVTVIDLDLAARVAG